MASTRTEPHKTAIYATALTAFFAIAGIAIVDPILPAIGSPRRRDLVERLVYEGRALATVVHPSAVVARTALQGELGCGTGNGGGRKRRRRKCLCHGLPSSCLILRGRTLTGMEWS